MRFLMVLAVLLGLEFPTDAHAACDDGARQPDRYRVYAVVDGRPLQDRNEIRQSLNRLERIAVQDGSLSHVRMESVDAIVVAEVSEDALRRMRMVPGVTVHVETVVGSRCRTD
jgi:hypothetical protein